jgi:hypothetical protein
MCHGGILEKCDMEGRTGSTPPMQHGDAGCELKALEGRNRSLLPVEGSHPPQFQTIVGRRG